MEFKYYNADGTDVTETNSVKSVDVTIPVVAVTGISIDEATGDDGQPVEKTTGAGGTIKLNVTIEPANATNKTVTWTSSNEAVATVDANGVVKGISAGTTTITATAETDTRAVVSASIDVRIAGTTYALTDTLVGGKDYLIATKNNGSLYVLNSSMNGLAKEAENGEITVTDDEATTTVFNCIQANGSDAYSTQIMLGTQYLYADSSGALRLNDSAGDGKYWHYKADSKNLLWFFQDSKDTTSGTHGYSWAGSTYRYYLDYTTGETFTKGQLTSTTVSLADTETPPIYLFVKVDDTYVEETSVSLDKSSDSVAAGQTTTLTATVLPENATTKQMIWTSSNESVATVENGVVTAKAEGTAVITATNVRGGASASCNVTVTSSTTPRYVLATSLENNGKYLIVNTSTVGSAYALKSPGSAATLSSSNGRTQVTVSSGDYIETDATDIVWTASTNGSGFNLKNGSLFLEVSSRALKTVTSLSDSARYWTYNLSDDTNPQQLIHKGGSSNYAVYYSNSTFSASSSTTNKVYLYKLVEAEIPATGISLNKNTLTLEAGESETLTATLTPANATTTVTWTSSDTSVATVANGVVTAVAAGTATITASAGDGVSATCAVTVTEPEPDRYIEVSKFTEGKDYIIAVTKDANTVYAMMHNNGSLGSADLALISEDGSIFVETGNASLPWTYTYSSSKYRLSNDSKYLTINSSSKALETDTSGNYNLTYNSDKQIALNYPNSTSGNVYYVACTNGAFAATAANATSDAATIRLFEKYTGSVAVTGVSLNKTTLNLKVGGTETLTATVEPDDATNKSVTWSTSDDTVATVDQTGKVTGVAEGTVTITVTSDADSSKSATCTVTVSVSNDARFELVSSLEDGGEYLIVSANSGSAYALKNPGGNAEGVSIADANYKTAVTIENGNYILTSDTDIVWTASVNGDGFNLTNGSDYLEGASNAIKSFNPQKYSARYWTYNTSNQLRHHGGQNTYQLRYSSSSNYFTSATNGTYTVYLFKKAVPTVDPEGITVSPTTLNLTEGETSTLTATVTPADANKYVTWTSSDDAVATVENGVVTAVGAGTATITAKTVNNLTATCSVTVAAAPTVDYVQTDTMEAGKEYLIVNGSTGSVFMLSNESGSVSNSLKGYLVNIVNGKISITSAVAAKTLFTASGSDNNSIKLMIGGKYLYADGSGALRIVDSISDSGKCWHYKAYDGETDKHLLWFFNGTSGDYGYTATGSNKYYLEVDASGNFTKGIVQNNDKLSDATNIPKIYLFVKDDGTTPHEHTYGTPTYTWSDDNTTCTATAVCTGCDAGTEGHTVPETVTASYNETQPATCTAVGSGTYTATFTNELFTTQTKDVVIPMAAHTLEHHDAVAATCTAEGNIEYWQCSVCNKYFSDATGTNEITQAQTVTAMIAHTLEYHDAVAATCTTAGNIEYWQCSGCNQCFTDAEGTTVIALADTVRPIDANAHNWDTAGANVTWTWAADYSTATATLKCLNDPSHTLPLEATVVPTVDGYTTTYTATATYGEHTYTDTKSVTATTHTVTFVDPLNEGTDPFAIQTVVDGGNAARPEGDPTNDNWVFKGWSTSNTAYTEFDFANTAITGDITIYAIWQKTISVIRIPAASGTIKVNGTAIASGSDANRTEELSFNCYDNLTFTVEYVGGETGYKFVEWVASGLNESFTENPKEFNAGIIPHGSDITVSVTGVSFTVRFNANGGEGTMADQDFTYNQAQNLTANAFARTGYTFAGWATTANGEVAYADGAAGNKISTTDGAVVDLYAKWTANTYTVHFNANGGEGTMADQTFTYGTSQALRASSFTKSGYSFMGWSTSASGNVEYTNEQNVSTLTAAPNGEVTLYAVWANEAYYLVGSMTNWEHNQAYMFTSNGNGEYILRTTLAVNDEIKAVKVVDDNRVAWYPDGENNNYVVDAAHSGSVTVYFRTTYNDAWSAFGGYIFIEKDRSLTVTVEAGSGTAHAEDASGKTITTAPKLLPVTVVTAPAEYYQLDKIELWNGDTKVETLNGNIFEMPEYDVIVKVYFKETAHVWGEITYTWADDYSTVMASRTCTLCGTVDSETVNTTSEVTTQPTCTTMGKTTYTATFTNEAFTTQIKTVENINALEHDWDTPTYSWSNDNSTVTATRVCKRDGNHKETETVSATSQITTPATCTTTGVKTWTSASFTNPAFEAQTKTETIPVDANAHSWGEPTYSWAANYSEVTATRVCAHNAAHTETETVSATGVVTKEPTCSETGVKTWTSASFTNPAFVAQTTVETLPIDENAHSWNEGVVTTPATCSSKGVKTYTCTLCGATRTEDIPIDPEAHDWNEEPSIIWAEDNTSVTVTFTCKNDTANAHPHVVTYSGSDITVTTVPATGTTAGSITYTAPTITFNGKTYPVTKTIEIAPLGMYTISGTVKSFTSNDTTDEAKVVTLVLSKNGTEVESKTVNGTSGEYSFSVEPGTYTLTVSKKDHATRTYTVVVTNEDKPQNVEIHLWGDVNGDGKVSTIDAALANWHVQGTKTITDEYTLLCADVVDTGDGVKTSDVGRINQHARKLNLLW